MVDYTDLLYTIIDQLQRIFMALTVLCVVLIFKAFVRNRR